MDCLTFKIKLKIKSLPDLEVFVRTAESGSLSAAARALDLSPAVASAALKRLESELGVLLFVRTTRAMRLTVEGERLLARCRPVLAELQAAEEEALAGRAVVSGDLQISMPSDLGRNVILHWLDEFQTEYPAVRLRVQMSDRLANVYRDPVDLAIRYGVPPDSNMVAMPLVADNRRMLCASPRYIHEHGELNTPHDLAAHNCLCFMLGDTLYNHWRFTRGDEAIGIDVRGNRIADDSDAVRRWAIDGHGICYRSYLDVAQDIAAGRLRVLCQDWLGETAPLYLVCPDRRQLSPTVRLLREFLEVRFRGLQG
jgi:DNA-binding transcriptional LysR family regulator